MRSPASESCDEIFNQFNIIKKQDFSLENESYNTQKELWQSINDISEFESFNESLYHSFKDNIEVEKGFKHINPVTIEEKLALIDVLYARSLGKKVDKSILLEMIELKKKKLKNLLKLIDSYDFNSKVSREDVSNFTLEIFLILRGSPIGVFDNFAANKSEKMADRIIRMVEEDLFTKGLNGLISQLPEKEQYSFKENARFYINRIIRNKAWKLTALPFDLPLIDQIKLPDELLEKILLDGALEHGEELKPFLNKIKGIDNYNRFRKIYQVIFFGVSFSYFYNLSYEKINAERNKQILAKKDDFFKKFKEMADEITTETRVSKKSDKDIKDEQFNSVLNSFREKYKEDPTPSELVEIKHKIYGQ